MARLSATGTFFVIFCIFTNDDDYKTDLQLWCDSQSHSFYYMSSCFTGSAGTMERDVAAGTCTGQPNGHLAFVTTMRLLAKFNENTGTENLVLGDRYWVGLYQVDTTNEPGGGWVWQLPSGEEFVPPNPDMVIWHTGSGEPDNALGDRCASVKSINGFYDAPSTKNYHAFCQYDETDLRRYVMTADNSIGHPDTFIASHTVDHAMYCGQKCNEYKMCGSFSFLASNGSCVLHWLDGQTQGYIPEAAEGYKFWIVN